MQTSLRNHSKSILKLPELKRKWNNFSKKQFFNNNNQQVSVFNRRNYQIRSIRYWFYLLHTIGADCWNLFVDYCIQEYGSFNADFSGFVFDEPVNFEGFKLENVDFSNSFFEVPANFRGAKFQKIANFSTTTFKHEVDFQDTYFENVIFVHAQFQDTADFSKSQFQKINFNQASFQKIVNFSESIFKDINFAGTVFSPEVDFSRATLSQELNLKDSNLHQVENLLFRETKFLKPMNCYECTFPAVNFSGAEFQLTADFSKAIFLEKTRFSEAKFLQEVKFLETTFKKEVCFSNTFFEKKTRFTGSVFHQNADFQKLQSNGELYFDKTLFKADAVFRNYHHKHFTSFKETCFEKLVEFGTGENYNRQLIDFTGMQLYFGRNSRWTTDYATLLKIQQLRHLAWNLKQKKLSSRLSQLERFARRGVKLKQMFSQITNFWKKDEKNPSFLKYFVKFIFFIFYAIPWSIRFFLFWPLGQISVFFYGTKNNRNYIRTLFFLVLSFPVFYFLYTKTILLQAAPVIGGCNKTQTYSFILQHYLPFVDYWNITPYLQSCFTGAIPSKIYNIVVAQSIFSILLAFFTLLPFLENIFNRIQFATKKTLDNSTPVILNPTEKTAILSFPSDITSTAIVEQSDEEVRKIRDEDIIDSPNTTKTVFGREAKTKKN